MGSTDVTGATESICYDTSADMLAKAALYKSVVTKHLPIQSALINESQIFSFIFMKEVNTFVDEEFYFRLADFARGHLSEKIIMIARLRPKDMKEEPPYPLSTIEFANSFKTTLLEG